MHHSFVKKHIMVANEQENKLLLCLVVLHTCMGTVNYQQRWISVMLTSNYLYEHIFWQSIGLKYM